MREIAQLVVLAACVTGCSSSPSIDTPAPSAAAPETAGILAVASAAGARASGSAGVGATAVGAAGVSGTAGSETRSAGAAASSVDTDTDAGIEDLTFADCMAETPAAESGATGTMTAYPGGRWTVPEADYATVVETDINIPMSDGVVLVGDVSYPADKTTGKRAEGKFPVLLTQNPYGPALFGPQYGELFVTHGYIFVTIDTRGTTRSGGTQDLFSPRAAMDGTEMVAWVNTLEGADGRVGLQGCSQLGITQLETVSLLPPGSPVMAMIPACPSGDFYRDTAFDNGIQSITAAALVPDAQMGADTAYYRDYWKTRDRVARAPAIARANVPTLLWSGWHEPGALGSLDLYTVFQNVDQGRSEKAPVREGDSVTGKYQVIIGDWGHGGGLDLGIELQFYDTWIKGIDTGLSKDTKTPLHLTELGGTKRWINARCYPLVKKYTPFYLSSGDKLTRAADGGETTAQLTWVVQEQPEGSVTFTSEAFADGGMLAGPMAAQLQVTSSNANLQLYVQVFDQAPASTTALTQIGFGSILGSLRQTEPEKSWTDETGLPARPFLTLDQEQPLTPGALTKLEVPLGPTVYSIEPGHKLVARISTHPPNDDCIGVIVPPVGCYPTDPQLASLRGGVYGLQLGGDTSSLISLPLLPHGSFASVRNGSTPTGAAENPLPLDW